MEREFEDVAAVIDAIATDSGQPVAVYGHSFGATCALGASLLSSNISALVLYEPPIAPPIDDFDGDPAKRMASALRVGDREGALVTFLTQVGGLSDEMLEMLRAQPSWSARVDSAPTLVREFHGVPDWEFVPDDHAAMQTPTLVVAGEHSPAWMRADAKAVAAALPNSRAIEFHGQSHGGDLVLPEQFAKLLLGFVPA